MLWIKAVIELIGARQHSYSKKDIRRIFRRDYLRMMSTTSGIPCLIAVQDQLF